MTIVIQFICHQKYFCAVIAVGRCAHNIRAIGSNEVVIYYWLKLILKIN